MSKKKIIIISSVVLVVVLLLVAKTQGWLGKKAMMQVSTQPAERRTIVEVITANGKIQPETEVKISPDVSGEIVELHIEEGDEVKEGDLLLKIKPDVYLSALDRMKATLNSSKANLANSKARLSQIEAQFESTKLSYERNKKLWEQKAISQAEWESALSAYQMGKAEVEAARENVNAAKFSVKSAEASLNEAQENLTKTTIYAPMNGTISMLNVEKGERVVGTMQMAGTEMLRIANLNKMEVLVEVNENDIIRVSHGDTALIEVDAYLNKIFKGIVTEIANSATSSQQAAISDQVTNFEVKIRILPESYQELIPEDKPTHYPFRPGMSATVDIMTHTENNVLSVPIQAVTTRSDTLGNAGEWIEEESGNNFKKKEDKKPKKDEKEIQEIVFLYNDGKVFIQPVEIGIQDKNYIQIISGLDEDQEVVTAPYRAISKHLKDSMNVEKVDREKLFKGKD